MSSLPSLTLFLPGAFAGMAEALRSGFAAADPNTPLEFHAFVPSGDLAQEILGGASADVYVSANRRFMTDLQAAGLVASWRLLARNRLCIIALPEVQPPLAVLDDVLRPGLRLVTPQSATDPCGQYLGELFALEGIAEALAEKERNGELLHSHGSGDLPGYLFDGRASAGMFYASEAQALGQRVATTFLLTDQDFHDRITFVIGTVTGRTQQREAADRFVAWMVGPRGQALLQAYGFLAADPTAAD